MLTICQQGLIILIEVRIVKTSMLKAFREVQGGAEASLRNRVTLTRAAEWRSFQDVCKTFGSADQVTVASGRKAVVFNIAHNRYRLIAAVHYKSQIVFTLMILTHKEYDRDAWKDQL